MTFRWAQIHLTLMGAATGLMAGVMVLGFRWFIETGQMALLPSGSVGDYEGLPVWARLLLPVASGLLLGLVFDRIPQHLHRVGVVHVIQQLRAEGRASLPLRNALVQFFAGGFSIITGHSVDREGPCIHLGAASGSLVGRQAEPADSFTLTAAGAAAGISAAFNTPLAGVVFVIEVLGIRHRPDRFIPIITASVVAALLYRATYGISPFFSTTEILAPDIDMSALLSLGVMTGLFAVSFIVLAERVLIYTQLWRTSVTFTLAGIVTGLIAIYYPQVMGVGVDSLNHILNERLSGQLLVGLLVGKLLATAVSIGLRMPGGLIGPSLLMGGALGGFVGWLLSAGSPDPGVVSFFAMLGMIAMMSAMMRAPLAAMCALLELTADTGVIFPAMVVVICADLIVRQLLSRDSVFEHLRKVSDQSRSE